MAKECIMDFENLDISPELREKAKACTSPEEMQAFAKQEGIPSDYLAYEVLAMYASK